MDFTIFVSCVHLYNSAIDHKYIDGGYNYFLDFNFKYKNV